MLFIVQGEFNYLFFIFKGWLAQLVEHFVYTEVVDGSSPSLPTQWWMYLLTKFFFNIIFILTLFFFLKYFFYSTWHIKVKILFFLMFHVVSLLIPSLIIFLYIFKYGNLFLYEISIEYNIQSVLIIRDPQEVLSIFVNFGFWINFVFCFIYIFLNLYLYFSNYLRFSEHGILKIFFFLVIYFLLVFFLIFTQDLFNFQLDLFSKENILKYEPDIASWYSYWHLEIQDLFISLFLLLGLYLIFFIFNFEVPLQKFPLFRFIPFLFLFFFVFYFFCGESFIRDLLIVFLSFIFSEILNYSILFWSLLKKFKF